MTKQVRMHSLHELTKLVGGSPSKILGRLEALGVQPVTEYLDINGKTRRWYSEADYKKVKAHVAAQAIEAPKVTRTYTEYPDLEHLQGTVDDLANAVARVAAGGAGGHKVLLSQFAALNKRVDRLEALLTTLCTELGCHKVPVAALNGAVQAGADDAGAEPH